MRITGLFLAFSFLSLYTALLFRNVFLEKAHMELDNSRETIFVELESSHTQDTLHERLYYFTYSGKYRGSHFKKTEQVDSDYYHSHSEGKNVEAYAHRSSGNFIVSRLRENRIKPGRPFPFLMNFSLYGGLSVLVFFLAGSGMRHARKFMQRDVPTDTRYNNPVHNQSRHS